MIRLAFSWIFMKNQYKIILYELKVFCIHNSYFNPLELLINFLLLRLIDLDKRYFIIKNNTQIATTYIGVYTLYRFFQKCLTPKAKRVEADELKR